MRGERPYKWPTDIPNLIRQAIEQAWAIEPDQRPTIGTIIHAIRNSLNKNQLSCIDMLKQSNETRKKLASVQLENFKLFERFAIDEFVKRITIDDCEAMEIFIEKLPPSVNQVL